MAFYKNVYYCIVLNTVSSEEAPARPVGGAEMSPMDLINDKISNEMNSGPPSTNNSNPPRGVADEMKENDSRFYPMVTSSNNGGKSTNDRPSNGGSQTSTTQEPIQTQRDFLRGRYYREEEAKMAVSSTGARKSPMPLLYPQSSRDSQGSNNDGSPTRSRPASRSSLQGEVFSKQPAQSPIGGDSYR